MANRKMTREQKIEALAKTSNEELVEMYMWSVRNFDSAIRYEDEVETEEELELAYAELMKRLNKRTRKAK